MNVNAITPGAPESLERLSGMTHLNGVPVRIERVDASAGAVAGEVAAPA